MIKNNQKGFTLIELLVVIAIIGILASIVISLVNSSRAKANDASIKANLNSLLVSAELYYSNNGDYGMSTSNYADCNDGELVMSPGIEEIIIALRKVSGRDPVCIVSDGDVNKQDGSPGSIVKSWAISAQLKSDPDISWCIDSRGESIQGDASMLSNETALCV